MKSKIQKHILIALASLALVLPSGLSTSIANSSATPPITLASDALSLSVVSAAPLPVQVVAANTASAKQCASLSMGASSPEAIFLAPLGSSLEADQFLSLPATCFQLQNGRAAVQPYLAVAPAQPSVSGILVDNPSSVSAMSFSLPTQQAAQPSMVPVGASAALATMLFSVIPLMRPKRRVKSGFFVTNRLSLSQLKMLRC